MVFQIDNHNTVTTKAGQKQTLQFLYYGYGTTVLATVQYCTVCVRVGNVCLHRWIRGIFDVFGASIVLPASNA